MDTEMDRSLMLHAWGMTAAHRLAPIGSNWDLDECFVLVGKPVDANSGGRSHAVERCPGKMVHRGRAKDTSKFLALPYKQPNGAKPQAHKGPASAT